MSLAITALLRGKRNEFLLSPYFRFPLTLISQQPHLVAFLAPSFSSCQYNAPSPPSLKLASHDPCTSVSQKKRKIFLTKGQDPPILEHLLTHAAAEAAGVACQSSFSFSSPGLREGGNFDSRFIAFQKKKKRFSPFF